MKSINTITKGRNKSESKVLKNLKKILKDNYGKKVANSLTLTEVR